MSFWNPFCRDNHIENFFCEAPIVIALSCGDPQFSLKVIFADAIVVLLSPMVLIVISYARILASILGRNSSSGRGKTFSTCASHLTVVIFFYTSAMFSYTNPCSTHGPDKDKPFSLLYTIITPMCNPVIYSFRNKEMKGAMLRLCLWGGDNEQLSSGNKVDMKSIEKDNHIENFFCEAPIVIALSCGDPQFSLKVIFADAIVVLLSPMVLIVISYARILASILGRNPSSGRGKTFSTCASHLTVVIFFYTSAMFSYMNPRSTHGPEKDKLFSLLYTIITPMCNPVIYSFRNKEMKGAMNPFCRDNHIENFFCEAPIVIALSCGDPQFSLKVIFADAIVVLLSPMVLIVISYARILASILGRNSSSGRGKTFSTCASHLTVVIFFYTSAMFSYMNPRSTHGPDKDKPFSLLYTIITPMCNPVIYSFRNKEMKGAMVRALGRSSLSQAESV
ncbi:hypothetical protein AB1E18_003791 [Capra hircus]